MMEVSPEKSNINANLPNVCRSQPGHLKVMINMQFVLFGRHKNYVSN